jgi:hypothetical protein
MAIVLFFYINNGFASDIDVNLTFYLDEYHMTHLLMLRPEVLQNASPSHYILFCLVSCLIQVLYPHTNGRS